MANKFVSTLGNVTYTENLMSTNRSALDPNLDLFYKIGNRVNSGNSRTGEPTENIIQLAKEAVDSNKELAVKVIGWSRSVRNGAGVRCHMRDIITKGIIPTEEIDWNWFVSQGYWKDIFYFDPNKLHPTVLLSILQTIKAAIDTKDNMILKWLPRKKKNIEHKNNKWIWSIRQFLNQTEKEYRLMCSKFVTPETLMCAKQWDEIDYNTVPSLCMNKNRKTFYKHDEDRIKAHVENVKEGKVVDGKVQKINVDVLYPHQIVMPLLPEGFWGRSKVSIDTIKFAEAQWSQLGDKLQSDKGIFVVADNSGSMTGEPMAISKALAIYLAEKLTGAFHNFCAIFSDHPVFLQFKDSDGLMAKLDAMSKDLYASNTNIESLFDMILHKGVTESIPAEDMPEIIMIISDMQFDQCTSNPSANIMEMVKAKYETAGYTMPQLVFWNVRNSSGIPCTANQSGVVLFSGSSVNSIKQAIEGEFNPMKAMLRVVDKPEFYWLRS